MGISLQKLCAKAFVLRAPSFTKADMACATLFAAIENVQSSDDFLTEDTKEAALKKNLDILHRANLSFLSYKKETRAECSDVYKIFLGFKLAVYDQAYPEKRDGHYPMQTMVRQLLAHMDGRSVDTTEIFDNSLLNKSDKISKSVRAIINFEHFVMLYENDDIKDALFVLERYAISTNSAEARKMANDFVEHLEQSLNEKKIEPNAHDI